MRLLSLPLLGLILFGLGCGATDLRPEAVGTDTDITIAIDSAYWAGPMGEALRDQLGTYIQTLPNAEPSFDLQQVSLNTQKDFERLKTLKNVVVVAPLSDTTTEARLLQSVFSDEVKRSLQDGGHAMVPRADVWRRHQLVYYVTAAAPETLVTAIQKEGKVLRERFNLEARERLHRDMFERGRQKELESYLMTHHGFAVNGQHDYFIATDTTRFVWLRRVLSDTWRSLFIYYEENADPSDLTPAWIYATRDSLTQRYLQGSLDGWVSIDYRRPLATQEINFNDRYGLETRGLWYMIGEENGETVQLGMGGPFVTYAFYDQPTGRLYMIDGMVFAPSFKKREFVRQMEVLAFTFRTQQEAEQAQPSNASAP